jgi:hypothetical protein
MAVDFNIMSIVQRNIMTPQEQAQSLFLRPTRNPEVTPVDDPTFTSIAVVPKPYKASTYGVPQEPKLQQDLLYERPSLQRPTSMPKFEVTIDEPSKEPETSFKKETPKTDLNKGSLDETNLLDTNRTTNNKKVTEDYSISNYNNPGNIEVSNINWEGLVKDKSYGPNNRFAVFKTPQDGINALRKDLTTKLKRFDGDLLAMIKQYAPSNENDVKKYLKVVQESAGVKDVYTMDDLDNIVKGFIRMENNPSLAKKYIDLL